MLNDLFSIERAFAANNISVSGDHPDVKGMAKGHAFCLRLDADARLAEVNLIADAAGIWTLRDGQHNGFPGLKTKTGLLAIDTTALADHDSIWKKQKKAPERRAELKRLIEVCEPRSVVWPETGHRDRIAERLAQLDSLATDPTAAPSPPSSRDFCARSTRHRPCSPNC